MNMIELYKQFMAEKRKWDEAGQPTRSQERMEEIHKICSDCPLFEKGAGWIWGYDRCGQCKCNLHPNSKTMNKLYWATTRCPLDEPKWKEDA